MVNLFRSLGFKERLRILEKYSLREIESPAYFALLHDLVLDEWHDHLESEFRSPAEAFIAAPDMEWWTRTPNGRVIKGISDTAMRNYSGPDLWYMHVSQILSFVYSSEAVDDYVSRTANPEQSRVIEFIRQASDLEAEARDMD